MDALTENFSRDIIVQDFITDKPHTGSSNEEFIKSMRDIIQSVKGTLKEGDLRPVYIKVYNTFLNKVFFVTEDEIINIVSESNNSIETQKFSNFIDKLK